MKIDKIKKSVLEQLKDKLPEHLTYHDVGHTVYVYEQVKKIGDKEGVTGKELKLLQIAALYHDIGFTVSHQDHEEASCEIATAQLDDVLSKKELMAVCNMIMATKIPQTPTNLLEQILADADLEYLGTKRFYETGDKLFQEMRHFYPNMERTKWDRLQIQFLSDHQYHTRFCQQYKEKYKRKRLEELKAKESSLKG